MFSLQKKYELRGAKRRVSNFNFLAHFLSFFAPKRLKTETFKSSSYSSDDGDAVRSPDTATGSEHRYWSPSAALPQPI